MKALKIKKSSKDLKVNPKPKAKLKQVALIPPAVRSEPKLKINSLAERIFKS